jgi:23S rRNA A2030 N6-methylase RlmJ
MHKAGSFIKCRHYKSVHGGAGLFTLEGVEANPTVHLRNGVTRVVLLKSRRL